MAVTLMITSLNPKQMISSDYEWRVRITQILQQHFDIDKQESKSVNDDLLNLINNERWEHSLKNITRNQEWEEENALVMEEMESRITRHIYRVSVVLLLVLVFALLLLVG